MKIRDLVNFSFTLKTFTKSSIYCTRIWDSLGEAIIFHIFETSQFSGGLSHFVTESYNFSIDDSVSQQIRRREDWNL